MNEWWTLGSCMGARSWFVGIKRSCPSSSLLGTPDRYRSVLVGRIGSILSLHRWTGRYLEPARVDGPKWFVGPSRLNLSQKSDVADRFARVECFADLHKSGGSSMHSFVLLSSWVF
ncbi:hypothetical protein PIB30_025671 [Stylosanthes scabra]|uniref:Uncharacterized protein n=1 Tax=Stylosanthes scabra TaxID=79078 RepID=A0ABU6W8L3_9FABA|nr:hypothetical protein [Stylosanthes scabra]